MCKCGNMFQVFQGLWFTTFYLGIETITFAILLSLSIGIASFFSFLHEVILSYPLGSNSHAIISILCATVFGEFVKVCQQDTTYREIIRQQKAKHCFIVGKIPSMVGHFLGILGFAELYIQYKLAHPSHFFETGIADPQEFDPTYDSESLDPTTTWLFLLSLCYISYSVVRSSDWMRYRLRITSAERQQITGKCTTYTIFIVIQAFLLLLYGIPIYFVALFCRATSIQPNSTFVILNVAGFILGANVAQLESLYPFPRVPLLHPGYEYENHLSSRVQVLLIILFPLICTTYYGPGKLFVSLSAGDKFLIFCLLTSLTLLQITKVLLDFRFIDRVQQIRRVRRNREVRPNPDEEAGGGDAQNVEDVIQIHQIDPVESPTKMTSKKAESEPDANQNLNNNLDKAKSSIKEDLEIVEIKSSPNVVVSELVLLTVKEFLEQTEIKEEPGKAHIGTDVDEKNENETNIQNSNVIGTGIESQDKLSPNDE